MKAASEKYNDEALDVAKDENYLNQGDRTAINEAECSIYGYKQAEERKKEKAYHKR